MAAWLPLIVKGLGHIATISTILPPVLTKRGKSVNSNQLELAQQQIAELQSATSRTDANLRKLAAELKNVLAAIEQGAMSVEGRMRWLLVVSIAASSVSALSLILHFIH